MPTAPYNNNPHNDYHRNDSHMATRTEYSHQASRDAYSDHDHYRTTPRDYRDGGGGGGGARGGQRYGRLDTYADDYRRMDSYAETEFDDARRGGGGGGGGDYRNHYQESRAGDFRRAESLANDFRRPPEAFRQDSATSSHAGQTRVNQSDHILGGPTGIDNRNLTTKYSSDRSRHSDPHTYELDHLLTLNINNSNIREPEDGLERLQHIEMTAGIWIMRVVMRIENYDVVIINQTTNKELERFPLDLISRPTASLSDDPRDLFGNLLILCVLENAMNRSPPEMHIFQTLNNSAGDIVDDIINARQNRQMIGAPRTPRDYPTTVRDSPPSFNQYEENARRTAQAVAAYQPPEMNFSNNVSPPGGHAAAPSSRFSRGQERGGQERGGQERGRGFDGPPHDAYSQHQHPASQGHAETSERPGYITDEMERNEQILNHCTDDIEKFISLLQYTANVFREMESRKDHKHGYRDGMMSMRARPPPEKDFVDILQKFKLALNLIANLRSHLYNPNASELIHFLFTPLSLVIESSKDPMHGTTDLASNVVSPLLTGEAIELLRNCLTSQETALWVSLGQAWNTSSQNWKHQVATFVPRFSDGWCPNPSWFIENHRGGGGGDNNTMTAPRPRSTDNGRDRDINNHEIDKTSSHGAPLWVNQRHKSAHKSSRRLEHSVPAATAETRKRDVDPTYVGFPSRKEPIPAPKPAATGLLAVDTDNNSSQWEIEQQNFKAVLISQQAKYIVAIHERTGRNKKELSVRNGQVFEVLKDNMNWYKLRNHKGEIGHAPYTILQGASGPW